MVARTYSMGAFGLEAFPVEVETDLSTGLPAFEVVGLPDAAVKESRDRVRAAMKNCGFDFPVGRIVMNLAPADKRKEGPIYDLPLLLSLLKASGQLACDTDGAAFLGELSLSGQVRRVCGVLAMAVKAKEAGFKELFLPAANAREGAVIQGLTVYPVNDVQQLVGHLTGKKPISPERPGPREHIVEDMPDFADVRGQYEVKRALEIAASGGHSVIMVGTPGSGKSMMAKRIPSILPEMTFEEALETTMIHSIAGKLPEGSALLSSRPFRAPHHTISPAGSPAGAAPRSPGRSPLHITACCFWTSSPSSPAPPWRYCASPWRTAW